MSELAQVGPQDRVLEIGTGSGYQAAVLARLELRVITRTEHGFEERSVLPVRFVPMTGKAQQ